MKNRKKLLIVGGGPAGMEAARVAAIRGFDVTLWEKTSKLGGNLWPASVPEFKKDIRDLINYQVNQLKKLPVKIEFNHEATAGDILKFGADSVILATGAIQDNLRLPGINRHEVITAVTLLLDKTKVNKSVLVVGGGLIGCETALYLAQQGHKVTLTSRRADILTDLAHANRRMLIKLMMEHDIQVLTNYLPVQIEARGILMKHNDKEILVEGESVISAANMCPCNELQRTLNGRVSDLHAIGDCVEPRRIINAIWEAFHTVRKINS